MSDDHRDIYVISDLHIGGRYPASDAPPEDRGFRLCTHVDALVRFVAGLVAQRAAGAPLELVINGDFVDFLAEASAGDDGGFLPFIDDPTEAARRFDEIADRDAPFFSALRDLVAAGGRLTLLLGNHDVELSFPEVRRRLLFRLGGDAPSLITFIYDGEAYAIGDALIEHGNRYDGFNVVDHDALRRLRSLQSRRQEIPAPYFMEPPPGSRLVATIMNPIKRDYPFVDLLKPETETVIPILLALEPGYRSVAAGVIKLKLEANKHNPIAPALPAYGGDIADMGASSALDTGDDNSDGGALAAADALAQKPEPITEPLGGVLAAQMSVDAAQRFFAGIEEEQSGVQDGDISSFSERGGFGLLQLVLSKKSDALEKRLPALLVALRAARDNRAFDLSIETEACYREAAEKLVEGGFRWVIFGHTHLAKQVDLGAGRTYLNTGTWSDLIRFPPRLVDPANDDALDELRAFVADLAARRFAQWIWFRPTYARLELRGNKVTRGALCTFDDVA